MVESFSVPPPEALSFRWPWRPYQQRVLTAIDHHLQDRRLHIVAAPGSGKTILGIEVFRRLGRPALILSPTRTIRNQWLERLRDFLPPSAPWPPPWASPDLAAPAFFTSVTYQALHAVYRKAKTEPAEVDGEGSEAQPENDAGLTAGEIEDLAKLCRQVGVGTLILDEAHHLRAEWWKALSRLADQLPEVTLVALTATPPYDVTGREWRRYEQLCGTIDEEISVPELVKAGNLCPHQDYLWMVAPQSREQTLLQSYDRSVAETCAALLADAELRGAVSRHPWIAGEAPVAEEVLERPELAVALLVYQQAAGMELPRALPELLEIDPEALPELDRRWWQVLIQAYLFDSSWPHTEESLEHRGRLANQLRSRALLWRRELRLVESRPLKARLSLSPAKIEACLAIYRLERSVRADSLRQVVLTDFIRDERGSGQSPSLGAWPVFRTLATALPPEDARRLGLLTGRLAMVHQSRLPMLQAAADGERLTATPDEELTDFVQVSLQGGKLTEAFTRLLQEGCLQVLVGTRAMLGEGWDAPCINSLVLASSVGSFMLTNQMRGRAIRIDPRQPDKVAGIWHLLAVDPSTPAGLSDLADLLFRFRVFVGLSAWGPVIESGLDRLALPYLKGDLIEPYLIRPPQDNEQMAGRFNAIGDLRQQWSAAIAAGRRARVIPGVRAERPPKFRGFHFNRTLGYLLLETGLLFLAGAGRVFEGIGRVHLGTLREALTFLSVAAVGGFLATLPRFTKVLILAAKHLPVDGSVRQIALALRDALCVTGLFDRPPRDLPVITTRLADGSFSVALDGGDYYQQALFADCLSEVLGQIENPRYLLTRHGAWFKRRRLDYHAVPQLLGTTRARAEALHNAWLKHVGPADLVYTREPGGRRRLLTARGRALSTLMTNRTERCDRWQ